MDFPVVLMGMWVFLGKKVFFSARNIMKLHLRKVRDNLDAMTRIRSIGEKDVSYDLLALLHILAWLH